MDTEHAEAELAEVEIDDDGVVVENQEAAQPPAQSLKPKRKPKFDGLEPGDEEYSASVQKRMAQLLKNRRQANEEVTRERARREAVEQQLHELRKQALGQADQALGRDLETVRERHQRAFSEGDAEAVTKAAAEMADLAARRLQVQQAQQMPVPQRQAAPAQAQFTPRTQAWINQRAWFNSNGQARALAFAADREARELGVVPDTDDYFDYVDERVRGRFPKLYQRAEDEADEAEIEDEDDEPAPTPRKAALAPVAPARRTAPGAPQTNNSKLPRLSAEEAAQAKRMGVSLQDWAAAKARRLASGKIGNH